MIRAGDAATGSGARFTIAAVAQRTGLSVHTLRAWERRYGIPAPVRTGGRYRLYGAHDLELIGTMQALISAGVTPSEAAKRARGAADTDEARSVRPSDIVGELVESFRAFDTDAARDALQRAVASLGVIGLLDEVVEPVLTEIGRLWETGAIGVDVEHFASQSVRVGLSTLVGTMERGQGRRAVLTCAPQERHDLALLVLAIRLLRAGWTPSNLGADMPTHDLVAAVRRVRPHLVCVSVTHPENAEGAIAMAEQARAVAPSEARVLVGGQGLGAATKLPPGIEPESAFRSVLLGRPDRA